MFERYTEPARRVLFFARYEASHLGSRSIETEHLLLGLVRQRQGVVDRIFAEHDVAHDSILAAVQARTVFQERLSTSVEIPFSEEMKQVLLAAMHEADKLTHQHIGVEHLLLGLLREPQSVGGSILQARGLHLDDTRTRIVTLLNEQPLPGTTSPEIDEILAIVDGIEIVAGELASPSDEIAGQARHALLPSIRALRDRLLRLRHQSYRSSSTKSVSEAAGKVAEKDRPPTG